MPDDHIIEELNSLRKEIEYASKEHAQAEGRLQAALERLSKQHGISEEDLEKEIERTVKREDRIGTELREKFLRLKEEYQW